MSTADFGSDKRSAGHRLPNLEIIEPPALPIEIWHNIYEFVPKDASLSLLAVNRSLFHIFMSSQYEHIHYDCPCHPGPAGRQAQALSGAVTSKYVKELSVWLKPLHEYLEPPDSGSGHPSGQASCRETLEAFSILVESSDLPALHTLSLISNEDPSNYRLYHRFRDVFRGSIQNAMQGISQTLRNLNLIHVPMEAFRDGIIPRNLSFPLLEDIHLDLFALYNTTDYEDTLQHRIAPFLNHHSGSLKKLSLATRDFRHQPGYLYKYGRLLQHLTHIPGLTHFSAQFYLVLSGEGCLDQLSRFIQAHNASLLQLKLNLCHSSLSRISSTPSEPLRLDLDSLAQTHTPQTLFAHHLFSRAVRSCRVLKELDCALLVEEAFQSDPTPFLRWFPIIHFTQTLHTLHIAYNTFKHTDLTELVSAADLSGLRKLRAKVSSLDLALFDAFASKLIGLEELTIWACKLSCRLPVGVLVEWTPVCGLLPYSPFLEGLKTRSYDQWKSLRQLDVLIVERRQRGRIGRLLEEYGYVRPSGSQPWISEAPMRAAFPHIQKFSGEIRPFEL